MTHKSLDLLHLSKSIATHSVSFSLQIGWLRLRQRNAGDHLPNPEEDVKERVKPQVKMMSREVFAISGNRAVSGTLPAKV